MRKILITGASGGIGRQAALLLASSHPYLLLQGRDVGALKQLRKEVEERGARAGLWVKDFQGIHERDLEEEPQLREIEIFIHSSGQSLYKLLTETIEEEWDALFDVHVKSAYLISRHLIPTMIRRKWGRIILISSIWGEWGASMEVAYSAAKGALNLFAKALAKELAPSGITVNAIAPGAIDTPMMRGHFDEEEIRVIADRIPLGRLGRPEEIAHLIRYLTLEESAYITGQILQVNGGWL